MTVQFVTQQYSSLSVTEAILAATSVSSAKVKYSGETFDFSTAVALRCGTPVGSTDAANKAYVDSVAVGLNWKTPASVLKAKDDTAQAGSPPANPSVGDAWVVDTWGGGYTDGDLVEWDGATWNVIVANSGGSVPNGTRAVVIGAGAAGSFLNKANQYATADGAGAWTFASPADSDAILVSGEASIYENQGWTFDTGTGWIQFAGPNLYTAGDGIDITSNVVKVKGPGKGLQINLNGALGLLLDGTTGGLAFNISNELQVVAGPGLEIDGSNQVAIDLDPNAPGLVFNTGDLAVKLDTGGKPGLALASTGLSVKPYNAEGIGVSANGVGILVGTLESKTDFDGSSVYQHTLGFAPVVDTNSLHPMLFVMWNGQFLREVASSPGIGEYSVSGKVVSFWQYPTASTVAQFHYIHNNT